MVKSRSLRAITITLLLVLFPATTLAQDTRILLGEALLRAIRDRAGLGPKPAYENRLERPTIPTEVAVSEVPEIFEQPTEPTVSDVSVKPAPKPVGDQLLTMVPAESLFCVRVNHFEYTLSQTDQFLAGVLPIPMGASMLVRMQFAQLLGSPQLNGVDMGGNFAIFVPIPSRDVDPESVGILVPITNYEQFVASNANVSEPDENGISKIAGPEIDTHLTTKLKDYALISAAGNETELMAMANSISEGLINDLATALDATEAQKAAKQAIWAYANIEAAPSSLGLGTAAGNLINQFTMPAVSAGMLSPSEVNETDLENLTKQIRYLSLSLDPKPNVLNITFAISAVPGTKMAQTFSADSPAILTLSKVVGGKDPKQMGPQLKSISALIPSADQADFVGTYSLIDPINMINIGIAPECLPEPVPHLPQAKSSMAFAVKVGNGAFSVDLALPKEHLAEVAAAAMMMQQQMQAVNLPSRGPPDLSEFKDKSTWVKCRNETCGAAYEMNLKKYYEFILENAAPGILEPPPLTCEQCSEPSVYRAVKCAGCELIFEEGTVLNDFSDRCPQCAYSKIEQDRKKAAEARRKLNR
jgi:hypothetical protein